jgi:hypothetical protein
MCVPIFLFFFNSLALNSTVFWLLLFSFVLGFFVSICFSAPSDKAYQLLAHGRWFSPGTSASSTTKTGTHDIAEILLKVALSTKNQSINHYKGEDVFSCQTCISHLKSRFWLGTGKNMW